MSFRLLWRRRARLYGIRALLPVLALLACCYRSTGLQDDAVSLFDGGGHAPILPDEGRGDRDAAVAGDSDQPDPVAIDGGGTVPQPPDTQNPVTPPGPTLPPPTEETNPLPHGMGCPTAATDACAECYAQAMDEQCAPEEAKVWRDDCGIARSCIQSHCTDGRGDVADLSTYCDCVGSCLRPAGEADACYGVWSDLLECVVRVCADC